MSCSAGPNIVESGLILNIDPANLKSYDGKENLCPTNSAPDATYDVEDTNVLSPDGNPSRRFYEGTTNLSFALSRTFSSTVPVKAGNVYNYSCYFKEGDPGRSIRLQWDGATTSFGSALVASFYPSTKTLSNFGGVTSGYQELENGWYRVWFVTPVATVDSATITPRLYMLNTTLNQLTNTYDDSTNLFCYYYGPQITTGADLKPYVRTTGTAIPLSNSIVNMADSSVSGNLVNGPIYSISNNGYFSFDGIDDYISLVDNLGNPQQFTVEFWCYPTALDGAGNFYRRIFIPVGATTNGTHSILIEEGGGISFRIPGGSTEDFVASGFSGINQWGHVACVYNQTHRQVYFNGIFKGQIAEAGVTVDFGTPQIMDPNGQQFQGNLANFKIYNRALSASEISQNFNALRGRFGL
jgi:hypothetical protein